MIRFLSTLYFSWPFEICYLKILHVFSEICDVAISVLYRCVYEFCGKLLLKHFFVYVLFHSTSVV